MNPQSKLSQEELANNTFEEEESNEYSNEIKLSDNIIDTESVDPFVPPLEIPFDSNIINSNTSDTSQLKLDLNSDLLFQSSFILNSNVDSKSDSSNNSGSASQIKLSSFVNDSSFLADNKSISEFNLIQEASKERKYSPPNISVDDYYRDLIGRDIHGPKLPNKEEIFAYVEPYSIEQYALKNFRKQNKFLSRTPETMEQATYYSDKPLSQPLLKKTDKSKKNIVYKLSEAIINYTNGINASVLEKVPKEKAKEKHNNILMYIIRIIHDDESLVEECFMQLMKQMRNSPDKATLLLAWKIFITLSYMFCIKDEEVLNVVRWFLVHKMSSGSKESCSAYFSFISIHDRLVLGRNFKEIKKSLIVQFAYAAFSGHRMISCSLYEQMWHQRNKFPKLPIPLMLYLVVKALIKNGVFLTPNPFPSLDGNITRHQIKTQKSTELTTTTTDEVSLDNENQNKNTNCNNHDDQNNNDNNEESSSLKNKSDNNSNNENSKSNEENHVIHDIKNIRNNIVDGEVYAGNHDDGVENYGVMKQRIHFYKKSRMKRVYHWINELPNNYNVLNDGEVYDLIALLLEWLSNLVDPIIPKDTLYDFMETFGNDSNASSLEKCNNFIEKLPLLHLNTLKYMIGFLREVAKNDKWTFQSYQIIANNIGRFFVDTTFATVDPFTMKEICEVSPRFILYCLENLDVKAVYPLNPAYEVKKET